MTRRVLHLRSSGGMLGAEQVILSLCANAQAFGYEPSLAVVRDIADAEPQLIAAASERDIPVFPIECRSRFDFKAIAQLRDLIQSLGVDVLHCHGYREDLYAVLCRSGVKLVTTNHLWKRTTTALRIYAKVDGYLMRRFDAIIAVSREIFEELHRLGISESKLTYVPNGIDIERFDSSDIGDAVKSERRAGLGLDAADLVLTTTGSLTDEKGHRFMLDALAQLVTLDASVVWLVVGDGENAEILERRAAELELGDRVRFLGRREDVAEILAVTDIFVLPSLIEGLPIALLEAMAAGKACVATRVGDVTAVIEAGVTGLTVDRASSLELAESLETLARDAVLRERLGSEAQRTIREQFSSQRMTKAYCDLYDRLLA